MAMQKLSITLPTDVVAAIRERDENLGPLPEEGAKINFSQTTARMLMRYLTIMANDRRELRPQFNKQECALILDACNGVMFMDAFGIKMLPHEIADAISFDGLDQKWEVDGPALINKLQATTFSQRMTLVDAVQRWWNSGTYTHEQPEYGELLQDPKSDKEIAQVL